MRRVRHSPEQVALAAESELTFFVEVFSCKSLVIEQISLAAIALLGLPQHQSNADNWDAGSCEIIALEIVSAANR